MSTNLYIYEKQQIKYLYQKIGFYILKYAYVRWVDWNDFCSEKTVHGRLKMLMSIQKGSLTSAAFDLDFQWEQRLKKELRYILWNNRSFGTTFFSLQYNALMVESQICQFFDARLIRERSCRDYNYNSIFHQFCSFFYFIKSMLYHIRQACYIFHPIQIHTKTCICMMYCANWNVNNMLVTSYATLPPPVVIAHQCKSCNIGWHNFLK